jgi:hypothetical protein
MDAGKKSQNSPQQAEENGNDEDCSHTHANDYSIWNISDCGLIDVLFSHAPDATSQMKLFYAGIFSSHPQNLNRRTQLL